MRSVILVIVTALGLAGLFVAYWTMQPLNSVVKPLGSRPEQVRAVRATGPHMDVFHPGDQIWLKQYDDNGQLSSKFRGTEYLPQPDGTVLVKNPVAQFFLANHQRIDVEGTDGNVIVKDRPDLAHNAFANPGPLSPPSRGRLNNVKVTLVDEAEPNPQLARLLIMRTNNVVFDNESYRIATEGYRSEDGREITDDQVPVHVTGQLVMEGRGLTVRWNDKDGRLELLEIAHGEWLRIDHPSKVSLFGGSKKTTATPPRAVLLPTAPLPEMLASNDKSAAGQIITTHPPPQSRPRRTRGERSPHGPNTPAIYRASFYDHVRITQQDPSGSFEQVNINDVKQMDLDFLLKHQNDGPTTRPSKAEAPADTAPSPAAQPGASPPPAQPSTQPAAEQEAPVYVFWTGVLRITPLKTSPPAPLAPGDAAVTLVGSPVSIHRIEPKRQGTEDIRCAAVLYETAGEKARLDRSAEFPQILVTKTPAQTEKDQRLTRLTSTGSVQYSRGDARVVMTGPGQAEVPLEARKKGEQPLLQAAWTKVARFDFTQPAGERDNQNQPVVRHGYLEGDVDVKHPELALRGHALELFFDPPVAPADDPADESVELDRPRHSAQSTLRQAIATTNVWCRTIDKDGKPQTIECQRLALNTGVADGKVYAREINATGAVHARGQDDDLRAEYVDLLLTPSKKPETRNHDTKAGSEDDTAQVELEKMVARQNVIAKSKEGSVAEGSDLVVTTDDGKQHMVLTSDAQAKVTDVKGNVVTGPRIEFDSDEGRAHVVGPGTLHAIQQPSATQPATPIDVVWVDRADFDGPDNRIDVSGRVHATSVRKEYLDEAIGEHIHMDLRPKPPRPSTQPIVAAATAPKAKRDRGGMKTDLFQDKDLVAMTVEQDARLLSTLTSANGTIGQQFQLKGPKIIVRELAADGSPSRSVIVPTAGRMGISDHRRPLKQQPGSGDDTGARGDTAFQWIDLKSGAQSPSAQLVYSENNHRVDITGDVLIVHQDEDKKQPPVRLNAQHVTAFLEPATKRQSAAGTRKQNPPSDDAPQMQLKSLVATGPLVVVRRDADQMTARRVDYYPRRHLLIATGTDRNPVVFNGAGTAQTIADRVEWDTITWNPKFTNAIFESQPAATGVQSPKPAAKPKLPPKSDRRGIP